MITKKKKQGDEERTRRGLGSKIPQNSGIDQEYEVRERKVNFKDDKEKTIGQGARQTIKYGPQLEAQWLAVRDEYLAHYPDLENMDTEYEEGSFYSIIDRLAKRTQRTPKQIQDEIMTWSSAK